MKKKQLDQHTSDIPGDLSAPAQRALTRAGIARLSHLTRFTEAEIAGLHGVGPNAIGKLRRALAARNLSFARKK